MIAYVLKKNDLYVALRDLDASYYLTKKLNCAYIFSKFGHANIYKTVVSELSEFKVVKVRIEEF